MVMPIAGTYPAPQHSQRHEKSSLPSSSSAVWPEYPHTGYDSDIPTPSTHGNAESSLHTVLRFDMVSTSVRVTTPA